MLLNKSPYSIDRFVNSSVSISTDEFRDIALETANDVAIEIYSINVGCNHDLPEKKTVIVPRAHILKHAELRHVENHGR